jgi:L-histidine Nalpha-methyltransferase
MQQTKIINGSAVELNSFAKDIVEGLSAEQKFLPSKYFYDKRGDTLFQEIMNLEEYYLTRAELQILEQNKEKILELLGGSLSRFNIVELGAGDGLKTTVLLRHFLEEGADFEYQPIDISGNALELLKRQFEKKLPGLQINCFEGDYFKVLDKLKLNSEIPKIVLFLGSTIGNFKRDEVVPFLRQLKNSMAKGDLLLIGFDLAKDPGVVLNAYNDRKGVTREFNLNLLKRINSELGGDFNIENFLHYPIYDPIEKAAKSFLISKVNQVVYLKDLGLTFNFKKWEPIFMEISQKYTARMIEKVCSEAGFELALNLYDNDKLFVDSIWRV